VFASLLFVLQLHIVAWLLLAVAAATGHRVVLPQKPGNLAQRALDMQRGGPGDGPGLGAGGGGGLTQQAELSMSTGRVVI